MQDQLTQTGKRWEAEMLQALQLAEQARSHDEVPVGAVVIDEAGEVIGEGFNQPIMSNDPTAHAEIVALRDAAKRTGNYRLPGATLVVTVEPCTMCAGALVHSRVARLVFGAREPRAGAVCSSAQVLDNAALNHRVQVEEGVLAEACSALITEFFQARRG